MEGFEMKEIYSKPMTEIEEFPVIDIRTASAGYEDIPVLG